MEEEENEDVFQTQDVREVMIDDLWPSQKNEQEHIYKENYELHHKDKGYKKMS